MTYNEIMKALDKAFSASIVPSPYGGIQGLHPESVYDTIEEMITREPTGSLFHMYNRLIEEKDSELAGQIVVVVGNYPTRDRDELANRKVVDFLTRVLIGHPQWDVRDHALDQLHGCEVKEAEGRLFRIQFAYELEDHPSLRKLYEEHYLEE